MSRDWYKLDTAALIFPAIARRDWCNAFRISVTLDMPVDGRLLQRAADDLSARFPSFYVCLRAGAFWYYLQKCRTPITVSEESTYPLAFFTARELRRHCMRIMYYGSRIAIECHHAVSDGTGAAVFLKNLAARYVELAAGIEVAHTDGVVDYTDAPSPEETEDSFHRNAAACPVNDYAQSAYALHGTPEDGGFKHIITGIVDEQALRAKAHEHGATVTIYLAAVMLQQLIAMQEEDGCARKRPVRISVPIDLRRLYGSRTLRNFTLVSNVGVDPRLGEYSLDELCGIMGHQLKADATRQNMAGRIAANVLPQRIPVIRMIPRPIKNLVMNAVYSARGEKLGCINISNLGICSMPAGLKEHVARFEFIIGPQKSYPNNCSVVSFGGRVFINAIRNIRETELERRFFCALVEDGLAVEIESNER